MPRVGPCPCECNRGGFCGGCGHAGCSGGINLPYSDKPLSPGDLAIVRRTGGDPEQPMGDAVPRAARSTFRLERRRFILRAADELHATWDTDPEDLRWDRVDRGEV